MKLTDPSGATVDVAEESVDRYLAAGYVKPAGVKVASPAADEQPERKSHKHSTKR